MRVPVILISLATVSCGPLQQTADGLNRAESDAVGRWLSDGRDDFSQFHKVRRADKTYTEYRFQVVDYGKPGITVTIQGTWAIKGGNYYETATRLSHGGWNPLIGKTIRMAILNEQTPDCFQHLSKDSAIITENRVNESKAAALEAEPFSFISPETRKKYGMEAH